MFGLFIYVAEQFSQFCLFAHKIHMKLCLCLCVCARVVFSSHLFIISFMVLIYMWKLVCFALRRLLFSIHKWDKLTDNLSITTVYRTYKLWNAQWANNYEGQVTNLKFVLESGLIQRPMPEGNASTYRRKLLIFIHYKVT